MRLIVEEYRSLYRKYRPQAPDEVLGQEHVVRALAGAVREGRLAHAFLFSGPRGTGKTSTARILAKMVNCEKGPTAEPDGTCEQCLRIRDGSHLDVVEIDAASHGGVDDARELRERAPTAPAQGREKVYIIDEAQRLSREAFDALLKVFEEPPPGVRFVLATTEPHKMPPTIAGRCQRFEFRRVPAEIIAGQLEAVAKAEDIEVSEGTALAIARESDGSVRDALSLLDQASVLGGGKVTEDDVTALVGAPETDVRFALADAIAVGDAREVFGIVHRLVQEGHDLRHFAAQVTAHFRDLLLALSSPEDAAIVDVPPELHPRLVAQAGKFSAGELDRVLSLLLQAQTDMRWSTAPRLTIELALVRAARPETDPQPAAMVSRIERLERLAGLDSQAIAPVEPRSLAESDAEPEVKTVDEPPASARAGAREAAPGEPVEPAEAGDESSVSDRSSEVGEEASPTGPKAPSTGAVDAVMLRGAWPQIVEELKARRKMVLFANAQVATVGSFEGDTLELVFPPGREFGAGKVEQKQADLREVLQEMFGIGPQIRCTVREGALPEPETDTEEQTATPEDAEALLKQQFGAEVVEENEEG
ncbi:MAG TPA: DNA polymerase III subunit gamma/tau [Actinomycetota bacterium]|nr:DNA polymerase III subunit gamma/tau [Actinomycetota bacterium]